jgi:C4-dicarboxylate-specific signal transduction histidine kinase
MYGVSFDVTPLKVAERELLQKHGELAHLSRVSMLGELSGSLAHELNQPLTAILSNAQAARRLLARSEPDVTEVREILNDIVDQDRRAGDVIQRLRQMLKKGEVQRLPLDVTELILESLRLMRGELSGRGVAVTTELAADMPVVSGDRVQLQQVLLNLVINASDAMAALEPADRRLLVRAERDGDGGARIAVSDRGCGIPADRLEAVFEPFVTTKDAGLGLGLAVCRTIVRAHGGEIRAENNGEGTPGSTFHFVLPGAAPSA